MSASHLIITGGTGYIGVRLVHRALAQGRTVTLLGRTRGPSAAGFRSWALGEHLPVAAIRSDLPECDQAFVHLAHDWQGDEAGPSGNISGTTKLFDAAAGLGARVFVSSQSARPDAPNRYGRIKWAIEQELADAVSLRVGLVYGGPRVAMYGLLCRLAGLRVLPMVQPRRPVQPIHLDEVVDGILAAVDGRHRGVIALAGPEPVPFDAVLRLLAAKLAGRRLSVIPLGLPLALLACDVVRAVVPSSRIDRERVLGLVGTRPVDSVGDLARLGIAVRPMSDRLAREPAARRTLLVEAEAMLRACLGRPPSPALLRRYARAARSGPIARPYLFPRWLRWREPVGGGATALSARLRLAARLVETSREGEQVLASGSRATRLGRLAGALIAEAVLLPFRVAVTRVWR